MNAAFDHDGLAGGVVRLGTIAAVDLAGARCTVRVGDAVSGPVPWLARANGPLKIWAPPAVGEQVVVLCPDGQLAGAVAVPGVYSTAQPAPASDAAFSAHWGNGAVFRFDAASGAASLDLGPGGQLSLHAAAGVTITGDVQINGSVTASGDVIGQGKSLAAHRHTGVQGGAAVSGPPQ